MHRLHTCSIAVLALLSSAVLLAGEETKASGAAGNWLKMNERIFVDADGGRALVFAPPAGKKAGPVVLVDLNAKTAKTLCVLPDELIEHKTGFDVHPHHAALSGDGTTLFLDREFERPVSEAPNGRTVLTQDMQTGAQRVGVLQRHVFALPVSGGKPVRLIPDGTCNDWALDCRSDLIIGTVARKGAIGLVRVSSTGKERTEWGMRQNKAGVTFRYKGVGYPTGGTTELNPASLADGRVVVAAGMNLTIYSDGKVDAENLSPWGAEPASICALAPTKDGKGVLMAARLSSGESQVARWPEPGKGAPTPVGSPVYLSQFGHVLGPADDGESVWMITYRMTGRMIGTQRFLETMNLKTGARRSAWDSDRIDALAKDQFKPR